jgi:4-amino-4-deoxy-L-arabinose transferase-like glycosyltransferase
MIQFYPIRKEVVTKATLIGLGLIWFLHLLGVFTPETGFDAVWYHLPIIARFIQEGRVFYIPELYQSVNPLFSDLIFGLGYWVGGEFGAKFIAYLIALAFIFCCYKLARLFLPKQWSLMTILIISTFQVVAWQSSSFYVDVAKALWEVVALWMMYRFAEVQGQGELKNSRGLVVIAGLLFGASLATKLFSLFLLPVFMYGIWDLSVKEKGKNLLLFLVSSVLVAWPFYSFTYQSTGTPFYSFGVHEQKLAEIGGVESPLVYFLQRTAALPSSLTQLTLFSRDYTTLLFLIFAPIICFFIPELWRKKEHRFLLIYSLFQYLVWWYLPPASTRYAVSGFATLLIILMISLRRYIQEKPAAQKYVLITIVFALCLNFLPRLVVAQRQLRYLTGQQSKQEYIEQFYDGNIDQYLKKWHHLP